MSYTYNTHGTCSRQITFDLDEEGKVRNVKFLGGCNGNLQGCLLYTSSASVHQATWGGKFIYVPTPGQFLHYIKNAACVILSLIHISSASREFPPVRWLSAEPPPSDCSESLS